MSTMHHSPSPGAAPFAIYEDPEDHDLRSPSDTYEEDHSFASDISGADVAIPSIEEQDAEDEPEPYTSSYTSRPSRRGSAMTANSLVSTLPSEISVATKPIPPANALDSRYSPRKDRPPFRNPSSVRAMQMTSPPPLSVLDTHRERTKGSHRLGTPSRSGRSESCSTNGTRRSRSHRDSLHADYQAQSPRPSATPQPLPLVLLHVTILPMHMPYTPETMVRVMPEWLVENYKVLEDKLSDIVLMRRGLLIQHPKDEYDVLEEYILESLELKTPRLLSCGHFLGPDTDDEDIHQDEEDTTAGATEYASGRGSRMSGGTVTAEDDAQFRYPTPNSDDASSCVECHRVKRQGHGAGPGSKRWDIKIYAANGLMRAGAWTAAWSEMERCDVEISPWIPNDVRKTMEKKLEQEAEAAKRKALYAAELQRQMEEEAAAQKKRAEEAEAKRQAEEAELQRVVQTEAAALKSKLEEEAAEKQQLERTLNEKIEEAKEAIRLQFEAQALAEANNVTERLRVMEEALKREREKVAAQPPYVLQVPHVDSRSRSRSSRRHRSQSRRPHVEQVPLGALLRNYVVLQLQDTRNFFILILGALVVFLVMNQNPAWSLNQSILDLGPSVDVADLAMEPSSVMITTTMTATSVFTQVVTETKSVDITLETPSASPSLDATIVAAEHNNIHSEGSVENKHMPEPVPSDVVSPKDQLSIPIEIAPADTEPSAAPTPSEGSQPAETPEDLSVVSEIFEAKSTVQPEQAAPMTGKPKPFDINAQCNVNEEHLHEPSVASMRSSDNERDEL